MAGDGNVVEEAEGDGSLALESWAGTAHGKGDEFYGPEGREHPAEGVSLWVPLAEDSSFAVHLVAADGDDLGEDGDFGVGEDEAVEFEFQPALPYDAAGVAEVL